MYTKVVGSIVEKNSSAMSGWGIGESENGGDDGRSTAYDRDLCEGRNAQCGESA